MYTLSHITQEMDAGESQVQGQPVLHSETLSHNSETLSQKKQNTEMNAVYAQVFPSTLIILLIVYVLKC
jgi:hypothetical protein